ncbi:hypothetical protein OF829_02470 [Sphingomonas sp. LB-2]|uniref:hypothetical protein n=1 Tax=Sphingomonas caeni TaxID=2984949 RepID=UPI00222E5ADF|nr:hypothetical protein [Sphingomonas caeni]MCW3846085.1 hypothetical protein [Sphingomonas caeni]
MRVFAGLILCVLGAAAASAMPPADDVLGNTTALRDSPSIAGRPDETRGQPADAADLAQTQPELAAIMDKIEGPGRLPDGAAPLAAYARYYAWADIQKTKVTAVYVRGDTQGRRWVEFDDLPMIFDGGCGVIELVYDVKRGGLDEIYCHGRG